MALVSVVLPRLDYCNVLLIGKSLAALHDLLVAQNSAARVITGLRAITSRLPCVCSIGWLSTSASGTRCSALSSDDARLYLRDTVTRHVVRRTLRFGSALQLTVPRTNSRTLADLCFSVHGCSNLLEPAAWWYALVPITVFIQKGNLKLYFSLILWYEVVLDLRRSIHNGSVDCLYWLFLQWLGTH